MTSLKRFSFDLVNVVVAAALLAACTPIAGSPVGGAGLKLAQSNKSRAQVSSAAQADLGTLANGNTTFALNLYQGLSQGSDNLFFSPYSISIALAMTEAGARGNTRQQMDQTLQFRLPEEQLHPAFNALAQQIASQEISPDDPKQKAFELNVANALWGQNGFTFQAPFLDTLAENYGAGMRLVDFNGAPEPSRQAINQWVSDQTKKKIENLIPQGAIDALTRLVLTNAIYFKAGWIYTFDEKQTQAGEFTLLDGSRVQAQMMSQSHQFGYAEGDGYQAVSLPYSGGAFDMVILLPAAGQFAAFERGLDSKKLESILNGMGSASVELSMPKFRVESSFSLGDALKSLGMSEAFDPNSADFSGMTGSKDLYIGSVQHKAYVNVDEKGTEAAAATAVIMELTSAPAQQATMKIDRPFIFLIRERGTGTVLFLGRVVKGGSF